MWLRTRQIEPGVHETQSLTQHVLNHAGIALAVLITMPVFVICAYGTVYGLLTGDLEMAGKLGAFVAVVSGLGYWHWRHYRRHPGQRRRVGPWD